MERGQPASLTQSEAKVRDLIGRHTALANICRAGWPDFIVRSTPLVAVEVKWGTDELSRAQRKVAKLLVGAGIRYYVVRVLGDGSFEIVELGGRGRVTEEEFARAIKGFYGRPSTRRGAATRARVKAVLVRFAKEQSVEPSLRKSKRELAHESGVSLETFNRHRKVVEREALLIAYRSGTPVPVPELGRNRTGASRLVSRFGGPGVSSICNGLALLLGNIVEALGPHTRSRKLYKEDVVRRPNSCGQSASKFNTPPRAGAPPLSNKPTWLPHVVAAENLNLLEKFGPVMALPPEIRRASENLVGQVRSRIDRINPSIWPAIVVIYAEARSKVGLATGMMHKYSSSALHLAFPRTMASSNDLFRVLTTLVALTILLLWVGPITCLLVIDSFQPQVSRSAGNVGQTLSAIAQALAALLGITFAITFVVVQVLWHKRRAFLEVFLRQRLTFVMPYVHFLLILVSLVLLATLSPSDVSRYELGLTWTVLSLLSLSFVLISLYVKQVIDFLIPTRLEARYLREILSELRR